MSLCVSESVVLDALKGVLDPHLKQDMVSAKQIKNLRIEGGRVALDLELSYPGLSALEGLRSQVVSVLIRLPGVEQVEVFPSIRIPTHAVQRGLKPLPHVKNIIAVASGKGGVGKSTTAANVALALSAEGAKVGILDADIYGPSLPTILGLEGRPSAQENTMEPMIGHGLQTMSIGFLVDQDTPMIWRGPMVSGALEQLLKQTRWHELDYLILDMPPGTGDVQLTVSQKVPLTGAVLVTTPQDIALLDVKKGLKMFEKVGVPILGIIENMAVHVCSQCGHAEHIFGQGGGQRMAEEYHLHYLGGLPLDIRIREQADAGCPTVVAEPDGALAQAYKHIAREVAVRLAEQARDMSLKFPTIVVQNT